MCEGRYPNSMSYRKLLMFLHGTEFRYLLQRDQDRAGDGINLRRRFALRYDESSYDIIMEALDGYCSVLEMIAALAIRCEETIMDDPYVGDRTRQWFWLMILNLGLSSSTDDKFDISYVREVVTTFLDREYEPNGKGGLFVIRDCGQDLRDVPIWRQLCWYLNSVT